MKVSQQLLSTVLLGAATTQAFAPAGLVHHKPSTALSMASVNELSLIPSTHVFETGVTEQQVALPESRRDTLRYFFTTYPSGSKTDYCHRGETILTVMSGAVTVASEDSTQTFKKGAVFSVAKDAKVEIVTGKDVSVLAVLCDPIREII